MFIKVPKIQFCSFLKILKYLFYVFVLVAEIIFFPFFVFGVFLIGGLGFVAHILFFRKNYPLFCQPSGLCIQPGMVNAYQLHGNEILKYFVSPPATHMIILDTVSDVDLDINPTPDIRIIGWRSPAVYFFLNRVGMREIPLIYRNCVTFFRMCALVSSSGIYFIRSIQHGDSALCGALVSKAFDIPHIVEIAGNYEMLRRIWGWPIYFQWFGRLFGLRFIARSVNNFLLGWPLKHAFFVIGRNKNNYEHGFALGAPVERLALIRIKLARSFALENDFTPPLPMRYMLFVARITTEKFPLDVLAVYEKLSSRYSDLALVVIGDGVLLPEVRRMADGMKCSDRIHILGSKPYEEVIRWTRCAAIAFETYSGSALAEKLICSVPVVAYDVEWMSEIIIDNFSGMLARFRDIEDAYDACCRLLDDPVRTRALVKNAKELALAMFDSETIEKKEARIFSDAIAYAMQQHGINR